MGISQSACKIIRLILILGCLTTIHAITEQHPVNAGSSHSGSKLVLKGILPSDTTTRVDVKISLGEKTSIRRSINRVNEILKKANSNDKYAIVIGRGCMPKCRNDGICYHQQFEQKHKCACKMVPIGWSSGKVIEWNRYHGDGCHEVDNIDLTKKTGQPSSVAAGKGPDDNFDFDALIDIEDLADILFADD